MIELTRLNGQQILVNAWQIESIEAGSDTRVTLANGKQLYVAETPAELRELMLAWFRLVHGHGGTVADDWHVSGEDRP